MKAGVLRGPFDVRIENVADPAIESPRDAIVRIVRSSVCGSDLWQYRGLMPIADAGSRTGHEITGVVEAIGSDVVSVKPGDLVVCAFASACGSCEHCRIGLHTSCAEVVGFGNALNGGHATYARIPNVDGTCWVVPPETPESRYDDVHLLTDVLLTGYHAAQMAGVGERWRDGMRLSSVAVVGDGAVGLSAVVAARLLGAESVVAIGHHPDRLAAAAGLGATAITARRGDELAAEVRELTHGGAQAVLECVGTTGSLGDAIAACRDGGRIGMVGIPQGDAVPMRALFKRNLTLSVGIAPTRAYVESVGPPVAAGELDLTGIVTHRFALDELAQAFDAMHRREAVKAMVTPS